jgi:hypothetical protein
MENNWIGRWIDVLLVGRFNGIFRILKWRYVNVSYMAIFWGDIP